MCSSGEETEYKDLVPEDIKPLRTAWAKYLQGKINYKMPKYGGEQAAPPDPNQLLASSLMYNYMQPKGGPYVPYTMGSFDAKGGGGGAANPSPGLIPGAITNPGQNVSPGNVTEIPFVMPLRVSPRAGDVRGRDASPRDAAPKEGEGKAGFAPADPNLVGPLGQYAMSFPFPYDPYQAPPVPYKG
jgi:hypothetical protein